MGAWFDGFTEVDIRVPEGTIHARVGGAGPPVLLLHGYPQTHAMWHHLAPVLAQQRTVVAADLRGYGGSRTTSEDFTFRAMAADQVRVMAELGFPRFDLIGHDRGARVAHRLAFDHPASLRSVALLDILPTLDVWRLMDAELARRYYHWGFLAQPGGLPQRLIGGDPAFFVRFTLGGLATPLNTYDPRALAAYEEAAAAESVVDAWCRDYRAAADEDLVHDRADTDRTVDIPTLVLWGANGVVGRRADPLELWRRHFPRATGRALPAGHFFPEETPDDLAEAVLSHLTAS